MKHPDVRPAVSIVIATAVIGALLGLVWAAWSPPGPQARILPAGRLQDETEGWVAADGRFLVLGVVAGLVVALAAWRRVSSRGPVLLGALAVGGVAGSALMWLVGRLTGGGSDTGVSSGHAAGYIAQQRISLHTPGLLFVQAGVAVLVYGVLAAFAGPDDLGRPDPARDAALVGAGPHAQYGGGYGDAPGALQQGDLPSQQPGHPL